MPRNNVSAEKTAALDVNDLSVAVAGHTVVEGISFTAPVGETTAIIGPNGAGKSLLLKAILRLVPKQSGTVHIFGVPHENYRAVAPRISYIPQKFQLDRAFPLTVGGFFALKSKRRLGMTPEEQTQRMELLTKVGMAGFLNQPMSTLSGGEAQRVLLAYSLMDQPDLLILDEPSAGIDTQGQETIYALLQRIQQEEHLTLILVSHELEIVMRYATQVLCINRTLLCAGVPREVLSNELLEKMYGAPVGHFQHSTHSHL